MTDHAKPTATDPPRVSFPSSRVLLVDDTPANLQVLSELLESAGFEIQIAACGADALRCLSMAPAPDLVLMDVMMPEMDGFETCRRMKRTHALRDIPVIFISASESVEYRVAGFAAGGVDYISKPFHADEVIARVGTHCRLTRIEALTREIMGRQAAEASLRAEEEKYRTILKTALDGFLLLGMDGQILEANDAYCTMSGYGIEELKRVQLFELEAAYNREQILEGFQQVKSIGYSRFTTTHRRKDGTTFPVEVSVKFRTPSNGQLVAFLRDLTQIQAETERQQALEEKLARHQRMEAVGRLAGGIAHDFNNMLGVIIGNVELAVFDLPTEHPVQACLGEVLKAARRSTKLTQQLLAFARRQPVVQHTINLGESVSHTLGMLHRVIGENIAIDWVPGRSPILVKLGDSQLDQILTNLCLNARDSIAGCGKIEVVTSEIRLDRDSALLDPECKEGNYGVLTVKDNGSGMDPETMEHAFEPFFTTKAQGKGTGLGLSTVEGIVRQ
ncbi:MAG: response regulator, partial [Fibrobacterota bacterium]